MTRPRLRAGGGRRVSGVWVAACMGPSRRATPSIRSLLFFTPPLDSVPSVFSFLVQSSTVQSGDGACGAWLLLLWCGGGGAGWSSAAGLLFSVVAGCAGLPPVFVIILTAAAAVAVGCCPVRSKLLFSPGHFPVHSLQLHPLFRISSSSFSFILLLPSFPSTQLLHLLLHLIYQPRHSSLLRGVVSECATVVLLPGWCVPRYAVGDAGRYHGDAWLDFLLCTPVVLPVVSSIAADR